jgi:hypothetical protein
MKNYKITLEDKFLVTDEKSTSNFIWALTGGGMSKAATIRALNASRVLDNDGRLELKTKDGKIVLFETIPK